MEREPRTAAEVRSILENAKLEVKDLLPVSQEIVFDDNFSGTDLRLIELEPDVLDDIQVGTKLVLRGDGNDSAVLCTNNATFELKEVETSNSLLILEQLAFPEEAQTSPISKAKEPTSILSKSKPIPSPPVPSNGIPIVDLVGAGDADDDRDAEGQFIQTRTILHTAHSYMELRRVKPNLGRLQQLLEPSAYKGESYETDMVGESHKEPITLQTLFDCIPASCQEIENYIQTNMKTFVLNGKIRLMEDGYLYQVLTQVLNCIEAFSWERENIVKRLVIEELGSLQPEFILEKVFQWFFTPQQEELNTDRPGISQAPDEEEHLYAMKEDEICKFQGEFILRTARRFTLEDFLLAWGESVPTGLKVDLKQLDGVSLTDLESSPSVIWYFAKSNLPENIAERFTILFETKSKWRQDEIMPYIINLVVAPQTAGGLLTKYARVHTMNGIKYYSAKHSK